MKRSVRLDPRGYSPGFSFMVYAVLVAGLLGVAFPLIYVVFSSFASKEEILARGFFLLPKEWVIDAYGYLFSNENFLTSFYNSVHITLAGTAINMVCTCLMAYGLSKTWLKGRRVLNFMVLFTMIFGGGLIPTYLVVKELHLLNSYWALFLTGAIAPFNLIVMRSFFQSFPGELEEAARIDGASELGLFWRIVLPLSMPAVATFTLFYAVSNWNMYFSSILYINDSSRWPLQVFLRQMLLESTSSMEESAGEYAFSPAVKMAAVVVTAMPLLMVYPFLQKYFDKGMMLGSVKG